MASKACLKVYHGSLGSNVTNTKYGVVIVPGGSHAHQRDHQITLPYEVG